MSEEINIIKSRIDGKITKMYTIATLLGLAIVAPTSAMFVNAEIHSSKAKQYNESAISAETIGSMNFKSKNSDILINRINGVLNLDKKLNYINSDISNYINNLDKVQPLKYKSLPYVEYRPYSVRYIPSEHIFEKEDSKGNIMTTNSTNLNKDKWGIPNLVQTDMFQNLSSVISNKNIHDGLLKVSSYSSPNEYYNGHLKNHEIIYTDDKFADFKPKDYDIDNNKDYLEIEKNINNIPEKRKDVSDMLKSVISNVHDNIIRNNTIIQKNIAINNGNMHIDNIEVISVHGGSDVNISVNLISHSDKDYKFNYPLEYNNVDNIDKLKKNIMAYYNLHHDFPSFTGFKDGKTITINDVESSDVRYLFPYNNSGLYSSYISAEESAKSLWHKLYDILFIDVIFGAIASYLIAMGINLRKKTSIY